MDVWAPFGNIYEKIFFLFFLCKATFLLKSLIFFQKYKDHPIEICFDCQISFKIRKNQ